MRRRTRVFAVASGGGHWQQLMLIARAFEQTDVTYATTDPALARRSGVKSLAIGDCSRTAPFRAVVTTLRLFTQIARIRPDVVVSTGALPGALALIIGKLFGARTIWIDSIANAEVMSTSGSAVRRFADLWLSQWEDVARRSGALYRGAVM